MKQFLDFLKTLAKILFWVLILGVLFILLIFLVVHSFGSHPVTADVDPLQSGLPETEEFFDNSTETYSCIAEDNIKNKNAINSLLSFSGDTEFWKFMDKNIICPFSIDGLPNKNVSDAINSSIKTSKIISEILNNIESSYKNDKTIKINYNHLILLLSTSNPISSNALLAFV
jgi:hypothetical protein